MLGVVSVSGIKAMNGDNAREFSEKDGVDGKIPYSTLVASLDSGAFGYSCRKGYRLVSSVPMTDRTF